MISDATLSEAWFRVQNNQGRAGTDGVTIAQFGHQLFEHLGQLRAQLQNSSYVPKPLYQALIPREGRTPRCLAIPAVRDRVLQTAMSLILTPILDPMFEESSFAYRSGRSVRMAIEQVIRLRDEGWRWVVDADIHSYFDEIDHVRLLDKLSSACHDDGVVRLVEKWIKLPIRRKDGHLLHSIKGVPQGSPLSPLLANLYLDEFDEFIESKGWRLVRFADDFLIFCRRREDAEFAMELSDQALQGLSLRFAPEKTRLADFASGFSFLGVRFENNEAFSENADSAPWLRPLPKVAFSTGSFSHSSLGVALQSAGVTQISHASEQAEALLDELGEDDRVEDAVFAELSAPPHLRTLYLLSPGLMLQRAGNRLVVADGGETLRELPIHGLDQVVASGHCLLSGSAISLCTEHGVGVHVMRANSQMAAHLLPSTPSAVGLRRKQILMSVNSDFALKVAVALVAAKVNNSRKIITRFLRHHSVENSEEKLKQMDAMIKKVAHSSTLDEVRGCEGFAARAYFELIRGMLPEPWTFSARIAHPPVDQVNALLSYGYAVLYANSSTVVARRGLDLAFGFLHAPREGHAALASDLMEPFRAPVVDAVILTLIFRHRIMPDDFEVLPGDSVPTRISSQGRRVLVHALEEKLNSVPSGGKQDFRRLLAVDALNLATTIEEDSAANWSPFSL